MEPPAATEATEAQEKASGPEAAAEHQSALAAALLEPEATAADLARAEAAEEPEKTTQPTRARAVMVRRVTSLLLPIYEASRTHC